MITFLNLDGTAQNVVPNRVFQGSAGVTNVTVVAPFPSTTALEIGFILPNGLYWSESTDGTRYMPMQFEEQDAVNGVSVWTYTLPRSVTIAPGILQIAINAVAPDGGNVTSYLCEQQIEESVLPNLPENPPEDVYALIRQYLAQLDGRTANVPNLVAKIQKASGNSFTYTDNKGVVSAPIALGVIDYNPTYVDVASVIRISNTVTTDDGVGAWQPVYAADRETITEYTVTITAAQHGQMRDGVTANDLWVSFDETENGTISGAYQGYTVSEAGDITISVKTPVAMTVRVWNGKGLADVTAREQIASEKERAEAAEAQLQANINAEQDRAESAESNLQTQINHIVQSGVDLTARAAIAEETERAEAAEAQLQASVENNANAIGVLQQAEQGLRTDVSGINAKIPSSASPTNQLADKDFVNSSINNFAAFYITPTAAGDEAWATRASLINATTFYNAGQARVPTTNDYAIVLADESQPVGVDGTYPTTRYSYQGGTYPDGQWEFQYIVNNTSLTQAQVNAINSGITTELVQSFATKTYVAEAIAAAITTTLNTPV